MAAVWEKSAFGTEYLKIGKIEIGCVEYRSPSRGKEGPSGYGIKSQLLQYLPEFKDALAELHPSESAAQEATEKLAVAFAAYIIRKVHGDAAYEKFAKGM